MNFFLKLSPIIEGLMESSAQDHLAAIKELLTTGIFSFFPLFIGAASIMLNADPKAGVNFFSALREVVSNGELILYSSSILAPILYLVYREPEGDRHFKERLFQGTIVTVILIACYIFYSLKFSNSVRNLALLVQLSYIIIVISFVLWYLATVFRNMMHGDVNLKSSEYEFTDGYNDHRSDSQ